MSPLDVCAGCNAPLPIPHPAGASGYGTDAKGRKFCYACCAKRDSEQAITTGKWVGYLTMKADGWTVSNWPGSLVLPVRAHKESRHNIAGKRYDVWFAGPDGKAWHGVQIGDNTQIARCARVKGRK